jgi:hypothetical protein
MYQQGVFFNGGMNTDDEDRLVPNGDYRYALYSRNYGVNTPMEGAIQSMTGNLLQDNFDLPVGVNIVIGSCIDVESKAFILFVWNEYQHHSIWRYSTEYSTYELILQDSILNFKKSNQIYHAVVVNNLLYWTDNYFGTYADNDFNPPRKINIQKAILYTSSGGTDPDGYSEITFDNLDWIKHPPLFSPVFYYDTDPTENANNLKNKLFQFRYQYVYDDNEESAWSPISEMTLPNYSEYITQTVNIDPYRDNVITIAIETGSSIVRLIRVAYRIGNTGEFFLYKEYDKAQLGYGNYTVEFPTFKNETTGPAISNSERNYDLIPQIAKTIEYLPSNEFAIGNYLEGYDKQEILDGDVTFDVHRNVISNTAFTLPGASYFNDFAPATPVAKKGFYIYFNPAQDTFYKYRFEPGDIIVLQLKPYSTSSLNLVGPDPTIYFTIPYIDPVVNTTDLQKLTQLCLELRTYLATLGIASEVKAPGSATGPFPSVAWPSLKVTGKTWYNRTQSQATSTTSGTIITFRENKSTRTFKSGASHEFAFQYYDRANRDGTVLTVPAGEVYVPFNTDLSTKELNFPCSLRKQPYFNSINLTISSTYQPPMWADAYQILYKPSTNIVNFQQRSVKQVIFNADSTVKLVLEDYYKFNVLGASINQTPSKGDFVRFVRQRALYNLDRKFFIANGLNIGLATRIVIGSTYRFSFIAQPPLYNDLNVICDPYSNFAPPAAFISLPGTYYFDCQTNFTLSWPAGYSNPSSIKVTIHAWRLDTGAIISNIGGDIYYNSPVNGMPISVNQNGLVVMTAGLQVSYGINIEFIGGGGPGTYPPSATLDISSYQMAVYYGASDYDDYNYYPSYTTSESNLQQELNVLSYDLAGGPNGEEVIIVNNFDVNLLGTYMVYSGTNTERTICTGGFQIEIYTPKTESENDPWYEVGIEFPIIYPHTAERSHGGDVNQVYDVRNGSVDLNCGDVYIRQRVMSTGYKYQGTLANIADASDNNACWFCEDPHYSDFYTSNWNNKGRLGLFSAFAKGQHLKASIYHTNALIDNTQINGLSRIEFFNNTVLKDEHGGINKLIQIGDTLKAFQDKKVTSVYIQKAFALNGDGTNNVILSDKTFAGVRPHDDDYGCVHPGSVSKVENNLFFYDFYNAAVVQATQGGLINVCDNEHKFSVGIRDFTTSIRDYNPSTIPANVTSHINRSNGEYVLFYSSNLNEIPNSIELRGFTIVLYRIIAFPGDVSLLFPVGSTFNLVDTENDGEYTVLTCNFVPGVGTEIIITGSFTSSERDSRGYVVIASTANLDGQGIIYSFNRQRWTSYMRHPVLWATQFGNKAYSVGGNLTENMGKLYQEDIGNELTFFDQGYSQQINFIFNSNPTIIKRFLTFMTQSNMPFTAEVYVPSTNQYPAGMASNILIENFRNQESYYVSKYFRDSTDPNPYVLGALKRLNGRELRGYVLRHNIINGDTTNKMILFSANVNFVPSEPIIQ